MHPIPSFGTTQLWQMLSQVLILLTRQWCRLSHQKLGVAYDHHIVIANDHWFPFSFYALILCATHRHHHHLLVTIHHDRDLLDSTVTPICRSQALLQTSALFRATLYIFIFFILHFTFFLQQICSNMRLMQLVRFEMGWVSGWTWTSSQMGRY